VSAGLYFGERQLCRLGSSAFGKRNSCFGRRQFIGDQIDAGVKELREIVEVVAA
jgi:hypothetical protein